MTKYFDNLGVWIMHHPFAAIAYVLLAWLAVFLFVWLVGALTVFFTYKKVGKF